MLSRALWILVISCYSLLNNYAIAQNREIDSLKLLSKNEKNDSLKASYKCKIGQQLWYIDADSSYNYTKQAFDIAIKNNIKGILPYCYNNYGVLEYLKGNFSDALRNYFEGLKYANTNLKMKGMLLNNIGMNYTDLRDFAKSQEYYKKTLALKKQMGDSSRLATTYNNIGIVFNSLNKPEIAKLYFDTTLFLAQKFLDFYTEADALGNIANYYFLANNFSEAEKYCRRAYSIKKELNDTYGSAVSASDLSAILMALHKLEEAEKVLAEGEKIALEYNYYEALLPIYHNYSQLYELKGNFRKALFYITKTISIRDTLLEEGKIRDASVKENEYSFTLIQMKDSMQNVFQNAQTKLAHNKELYKQKLYSYAGIIAFIFMLVISLFIYRAFNEKRKSHSIISQQKKEVEYKNHIIEEKQKEILDSIHYAKRIQTALLANKELIDSNIPSNFILFKPKDIVSGDFYWATEHNNKFYLAACDSTGHGVPGAFMSLLNIGFLSEAIKEKNIEEPGEIFNYVRERLISSISNEGQKDGMDGILMCYNKVTKELTYVAANNSPILISNNQITELSKDRMPIGKGERNESFITHKINYKVGDTLYLYTDGYADQFGGPKGKKFKYRALNESLLINCDKNVKEQKNILEQQFIKWKANLEQVDDVLIIGIKL